MDFASRNLYRSAIEEIARGSKRSELEITQAAMQAAQPHVKADGDGDQAGRESPAARAIRGIT